MPKLVIRFAAVPNIAVLFIVKTNNRMYATKSVYKSYAVDDRLLDVCNVRDEFKP